MNKNEARKFRNLTYFSMKDNSAFKKFIVKKFDAFRVEMEKSLVNVIDLSCQFIHTVVRFISNTIQFLKTIGIVTILISLLLTFVLLGCAHDDYYAHLWCRSSAKYVSFGLYTQDDGKLMVKIYDTDDCLYVRDQNVMIEYDHKTAK